MGMLDGLIGGMVGAAMVPVVTSLLERHGGVQGMVNQLQSQGLGPAVKSWVAEGPNTPVTPGQMHQAFGEQTINELAAKAGMTPAELAQKLATVLPHTVNALTPDGVVPNG